MIRLARLPLPLLQASIMKWILSLLCVLSLTTACDMLPKGEKDTPMRQEDEREARRGKLTGEDGWNLLGGDNEDKESGARLGVNSFVWRATLDTLAFMPFTAADPFGGTILTDWYEDPATPGERFKINALILDATLRADTVKVSLFKQKVDENTGQWRDVKVNPELARKLENTILTRARELRVQRITGQS